MRCGAGTKRWDVGSVPWGPLRGAGGDSWGRRRSGPMLPGLHARRPKARDAHADKRVHTGTGAGPSPRNRRLYIRTLGSCLYSPHRPGDPAVTSGSRLGDTTPPCVPGALEGKKVSGGWPFCDSDRTQEAAVVRGRRERPCSGPGVELRARSWWRSSAEIRHSTPRGVARTVGSLCEPKG